MTEWYVYSEGFGGTWEPREIILGRSDAARRLTRGFRITPDERRRLTAFLEGGLCTLHSGPFVVGYEDAQGARISDRRLTRVVGPGTEV